MGFELYKRINERKIIKFEMANVEKWKILWFWILWWERGRSCPFYCGWTESLVQSPREVLFFIIQSIKTMEGVVGPNPKSKNWKTWKGKIIRWVPSHSSNHFVLPLAFAFCSAPLLGNFGIPQLAFAPKNKGSLISQFIFLLLSGLYHHHHLQLTHLHSPFALYTNNAHTLHSYSFSTLLYITIHIIINTLCHFHNMWSTLWTPLLRASFLRDLLLNFLFSLYFLLNIKFLDDDGRKGEHRGSFSVDIKWM